MAPLERAKIRKHNSAFAIVANVDFSAPSLDTEFAAEETVCAQG